MWKAVHAAIIALGSLVIVLLLSNALLVSSGGETWERLYPTPNPGLKKGSAWAYDNLHNVVIMFGGAPGGGQTWVYHLDTQTWEQKFPALSPPARSVHQMAFDSKTGVAVIFGGLATVHGSELSDTWTYNYETNSWTEIVTQNKPPPRHWGSLIYDPLNKVVVLFGCHYNRFGSPDTMYSDTWILELDLKTWTERTQISKPSARQTFPIYNERDGLIYYFGGKYETSETLRHHNDIWAYNVATNTWTVVMDDSNVSSKPSDRRTKWTYDPINNYGILFSGTFTPIDAGDTWIFDFDSKEWSKLDFGASPVPIERFANLIIYDPVNRGVLLYGGVDNSYQTLGDMWRLEYPDKNPPQKLCLGHPPTIEGTSGNDAILGTAGDDVILAGDGDDTIKGLAGDDLICGEMGNDTIYGGAGSDQISGDEGNDRIYGTDGDDQIFGGPGDDTLSGGLGVDSGDGGSGINDTCYTETKINCP